MINKNYEIRELPWDSNFFGVKASRIDIFNELEKKDIEEIDSYLKTSEFITITNSRSKNLNNFFIGSRTKAYLTDINIQLEKKVIKNIYNNENIIIENNKIQDGEIIKLAKESFENSRFMNDVNIEEIKAGEIYENWVRNSFNKIDKYFIICKIENKINGFILFSINNNRGLIELIAVNKEKRRSGIGMNLIKALEKFLSDRNIEILRVGTQVENINAINFYEYCGFKIKDIKYIYHLWN